MHFFGSGKTKRILQVRANRNNSTGKESVVWLSKCDKAVHDKPGRQLVFEPHFSQG